MFQEKTHSQWDDLIYKIKNDKILDCIDLKIYLTGLFTDSIYNSNLYPNIYSSRTHAISRSEKLYPHTTRHELECKSRN